MPVDATLPFLSAALDAHAMRGVFERQCNEIEVTACEIERVKYRPLRNCIIGYKLTLRDAAGEREQRLCAGIYDPDDAVARYEKALPEATVATAGFAPVTLIQSLNMVLWAFPNERKLTPLPIIADVRQLRENVLPEVVHARWGTGWDIVDLTSAISNYFPEHSCCVSVSLTLNNARSGLQRSWDILGKTRYDDDGAQTYRHMAALWSSSGKSVAYARPIIYQREPRLLWQERVPGVTLHSLLAPGVAGKGLLVRVARAIAALHSTSVAHASRVTLSGLVERLAAAKKIIAAAHPHCAAELHRTVETLVGSVRDLNADHTATWHGDLHSKNILISSAQIYFIDMDRVAAGPPLAELGSFLAELVYRGNSDGESLQAMQPNLTAIVAAYREHVSWPVPESEVAWFTASALIYERALRCVTSLKPGRSDNVGNLVAVAASIVGNSLCFPFVDARNELGQAA